MLSKHGRNWDDAPIPGVGLGELDGRTLAEFRRRGIASGRLPSGALNESGGDLIEMLRLREGEYLRRAAVLLFHPDPVRFFAGAFVKIGYFRTETDLAYQDIIEGNLFAGGPTVDVRTKYSKPKYPTRDLREKPARPRRGLARRRVTRSRTGLRTGADSDSGDDDVLRCGIPGRSYRWSSTSHGTHASRRTTENSQRVLSAA